MLCGSRNKNTNKAEESDSVLQPPASLMNKYTETTLITSCCQMGADPSSKFSVHIVTHWPLWIFNMNELDVRGYRAEIYSEKFPY